MIITVTAHHVKITDALKQYAEKKLSKLLKFFDNIQKIDIHLKIEGVAEEESRQIVDANIEASQARIRASETSRDMYASVDMVYDKLEVQLTRHKEKLRDNHHKGHKERRSSQNQARSTKAMSDEHNLIIKKPMTPEDAAELYEDGQPFLFFRNSKSQEMNVLYPLNDGGLSLIEP